jgi:hypothetical protein
MKYIKKFNESEKSIEDWCKYFLIQKYTIGENGIVNVAGGVIMVDYSLNKFPIKFGIVNGYFDCRLNKLITLIGCPSRIGADFDCSDNKLTTLEGCPKEVGGKFKCKNNNLYTLKGIPLENKYISFSGNPVYTLALLFGYLETFLSELDDYKFISSDGDIYEKRFKKACEDAGIDMPKSIPGYTYI